MPRWGSYAGFNPRTDRLAASGRISTATQNSSWIRPVVWTARESSGAAAAPKTLLRLFAGENFAMQLVKVADMAAAA